ncbi:MAG: FxsA family protein [Gammaproteobacteria bacterium]
MPLPLIILLLAPLLDIFLLLRWLFDSPLAAGLYWAAATALGMLLLKFAKIGFAEMAARMRGGRVQLSMFGGFAAIWFAGALLCFPGYLSDAAALAVFVMSFFARKKNAEEENRPLEIEAETVDSDEREN